MRLAIHISKNKTLTLKKRKSKMKIKQALANLFNVRVDEIDYEINEEEDEYIVFGTNDDNRFDTVVVSRENI
jgi:ribosomal protein L23